MKWDKVIKARSETFIDDLWKLWRDKEIAVVGNGELGEFGEEIDSYAVVIRFNDAPVKGYEKYCGSKTTARVTSSWNILNNVYLKQDLCEFYIFAIIKDQIFVPHEKVWILEKDRAMFEALGLSRPTVGCILLYELYRRKIKAKVFGFDFAKSVHYYNWKDALNSDFWGKDKYYKLHPNRVSHNKVRHDFEREEAYFKFIDWFHFRC